jgi:hypothetical protein
MVNFLYRGDYRNLSQFMDTHPVITDAAVGTMLFGQWDKVALETDMIRQDTRLRWVNPDRVLINNASGPLNHFLQDESKPFAVLRSVLDASPPVDAPPGLQGYSVSLPEPGTDAVRNDTEGTLLQTLTLGESMVLEAIETSKDETGDLIVRTWWRVVATLPLPPEKLYPPPYGVYGGPRLSVFAHLLAGGKYYSGDDGLWVDPYSLYPGDRLLQVHRFILPENDDDQLKLAIGLYDPWIGQRWQLADGRDQILIALDGE